MISSQDYEQLCLWLRSAPGLTVAGVFGAIWGSFANVCIYRIPRGESLVRPGSHCPGCQAEIAWYDNLPILSWLLLAGRCRRCRAVIPLQYPLVEALLLGLALLLYRRFVWDDGGPMGIALSRFVTYFFFSLTLVVLSVIDLRTLLLPDRITYPAIPLFFPARPGLWPDLADGRGPWFGCGLRRDLADRHPVSSPARQRGPGAWRCQAAEPDRRSFGLARAALDAVSRLGKRAPAVAAAAHHPSSPRGRGEPPTQRGPLWPVFIPGCPDLRRVLRRSRSPGLAGGSASVVGLRQRLVYTFTSVHTLGRGHPDEHRQHR